MRFEFVAFVYKTNKLTKDTITGFLSDKDGIVDYYSLRDCVSSLEAGYVNTLSWRNNELVLDVKEWWLQSIPEKSRAIYQNHASLQSYLDEQYRVQEDVLFSMYYKKAFLFMCGPTVKLPLLGVVMPLLIFTPPDHSYYLQEYKQKSRSTDYFHTPKENCMHATIINLVFDIQISAMSDLPIVMDTSLLDVDAIATIKQQGGKVRLYSNPAATKKANFNKKLYETHRDGLNKLQTKTIDFF